MAGPGKNFTDYTPEGASVTESFTEDWQPQRTPARSMAERLENTPETGRRVHLKDKSTGAIVNIDERDLGAMLNNDLFSVASDQEVQTEREKGKPASLSKQAIDTMAAFQISWNKGAYDAVTALPRGIVAGGIELAGGDGAKFFEETSGAKVVENLAYVGSEALGISGEKGARIAKEEQQRLDEEHGIASTAGRVGGEGAGLLVGGVGRLGTGLASAVVQRTGSKALGLAAAGGVEGAVLGAGQAAESAYIADEELTGEKILGSTAMGGLIGAGTGLGLAGLGNLTSRVARRVLRDGGEVVAAGAPKGGGLAETFRKIGRERSLKAVGFRQSEIRKLARKGAHRTEVERQMAKVGDELEGLLSKTGNLDETSDLVDAAVRKAGEEIGATRKAVDELIEKAVAKGDDLTFAPSSKALTDDIGERVLRPMLEHPDQVVRSKAVQVEQVMKDITRMGDNPTTGELTRLRQSLWENQINERGMGIVQAKLGTEHLQQAAKLINEHVDVAIEKGALKLGDEAGLDRYIQAKMRYSALKDAQKSIGRATAAETGNRFFSLSDNIMGGAAFAADMAGGGGLVSGVKGIAVGAAHKVGRERSNAIIANAAFKIARHLDGQVDDSLKAFFKKASGDVVKLPAKKRTQAAALAAAAGVSPAMAMFMGEEKSPQKAYRKRVDEIHRATENMGGGIRNALPKEFAALRETHPKLYTHLGVKATVAADFLKSKMPTALLDMRSMTPRSSRPIPSSLEVAEFARYYNTVMDPSTALKDLVKGQLTSEQVEALQTVYPRMYEKLRLKAVEMITAHDRAGKPLPFPQRSQLSLLLDLGDAGDPLLSTDFALKVQNAAAQVRSQREQKTTRPPGNGGAEKVERLKPRSQEL